MTAFKSEFFSQHEHILLVGIGWRFERRSRIQSLHRNTCLLLPLPHPHLLGLQTKQQAHGLFILEAPKTELRLPELSPITLTLLPKIAMGCCDRLDDAANFLTQLVCKNAWRGHLPLQLLTMC